MKLHATVPESTACPHCHHNVDVAECEPFETVECPMCDKAFEVPASFGRFMLHKVAGAGQMGVVFKAWDASVSMWVALKVAREETDDNSVYYQSLKSEVGIAGGLRHQHLISVYDYGRINGHPYIAMEYISGGTLKDRLDAKSPLLKERHILEWALHICEGLKAANHRGMVHGDLKPANILFDHNGVCKVADFGLARAGGQASNEVWGTPMYIAPEKAQGKGEDHRSDMYSLGVIMWQCMADGVPPFDAPTSTGLVAAHVYSPIPDILNTNPDISYHTSIILRRLLAKVPDRRFPTYDYAMAELRAAQKSAQKTFNAKR